AGVLSVWNGERPPWGSVGLPGLSPPHHYPLPRDYELLHLAAAGTPNGAVGYSRRSTGRSASRTDGSSMVLGTGSSRPSAIPRIVLRRILPERVFGSAGTTATSLRLATAPTWSRTSCTSSARSSSSSRSTPALSTTKPRGT